MDPTQHLKFVVPGDDPPQIQGSAHLDRLKPYGEVLLFTDKPASFEEQITRANGAHVILNTRGSTKWMMEAINLLPDLKMISTCSIGTDMIDLLTTRERGIIVSNQPGRTAPFVAEHIIGIMFAVAKRVAYQTKEIKEGRWAVKQNVFLQGKTMGIVGTGNIGGEVARLSSALGMRNLAWTFNPSPDRATKLGVEFVSLDYLLRHSDVVSLHVKLSNRSHQMIGRRELSIMKSGAILINCGRGELLDTNALVDTLNSGHLAGAGLDVFDMEPIPPNHPILSCEQVTLTPHIADQTPEAIELLNKGCVDNVIAFIKGHPQNVAN